MAETPKKVEDTTRNDVTRIALPDELGLGTNVSERHASLVVLAGWEIGREIMLDGNELVVGRLATADVPIGVPSVSRQHATIRRLDDGEKTCFEITDLKSSNGVRVNNNLVQTKRLDNGDMIQLGEVVMKFVVQDDIEANFYKEVHRRIHYDQLTGLMTMESFQRLLAMRIEQAEPGQVMALAMTDLDGLKRVNDTYGHLAGRMVVREMGTMIRDAVRTSDVPALYGGDEAIILFPHTRLDQAGEVAERLRERIAAREFTFNDQRFGVTISQGLAEWPRHGTTPESLIAAADRALYAAKGAGRNRVVLAGA